MHQLHCRFGHGAKNWACVRLSARKNLLCGINAAMAALEEKKGNDSRKQVVEAKGSLCQINDIFMFTFMVEI